MLVHIEDDGAKLYYHEPKSDDVAHRYLAKLLELKLIEATGEGHSYGDRPCIIVRLKQAHHLGAMELLVEGPHSGEIINEYLDELKILGLDFSDHLSRYYRCDELPSDADEELHTKLMKFSCEVMYRSFVELAYGEMSEVRAAEERKVNT